MYINAYVLSVPEEKKDDYIKLANIFAEVAKDYGVLEITENWEEKIPDGEQTDFRKAVKAQPGEKVVVSWVVWPDKEKSDLAHKEMFSDPRMAEAGEMPFDGKRMIFGDFKPILRYLQSEE